jgi:hypothetical protein
MCDEHTEESNEEYFKRTGLSRRTFGALSAAAALAACASAEPPGGAMEIAGRDVNIKTADGECDA